MLDYRTIYRDIAPKAVLIDGALSYARGRLGVAGIVTLDVLKEGALEVVKSLAIDKLRPGIDTLLANAVAGFVTLKGERPAPGDRGDSDEARMEAGLFEARVAAPWRDAFDDWLIAQIGSDLARAIGPSCMGEHFTDSDVDDPAVRAQVAIEIAHRLAESAMVMHDPGNTGDWVVSVNKTLSAAGIVDSDLLPNTSAQATAATTQEKETMAIIDEATARARVEQVVQGFAIRTGADAFDPILLGELLGAAFDEDSFISLGAVERMGGSKEDVDYFRAYLLAAPLEVHSNTMTAAMAALATGAVVEPPKPVKAKRIKVHAAPVPSGGPSSPSPMAPPPLAPPGQVSLPSAPGGASTPLPPVAGDGDYGNVVKLWREHGKDNDESIGKHLGVSRAQVSNIGGGKVKCPLTPAQRQAIQAALNVKIAGLMSARDLLG